MPKNGDFNVIVAHYDQPGNFQGQFLANVDSQIDMNIKK